MKSWEVYEVIDRLARGVLVRGEHFVSDSSLVDGVKGVLDLSGEERDDASVEDGLYYALHWIGNRMFWDRQENGQESGYFFAGGLEKYEKRLDVVIAEARRCVR